jgi:hypothetical protein
MGGSADSRRPWIGFMLPKFNNPGLASFCQNGVSLERPPANYMQVADRELAPR